MRRLPRILERFFPYSQKSWKKIGGPGDLPRGHRTAHGRIRHHRGGNRGERGVVDLDDPRPDRNPRAEDPLRPIAGEVYSFLARTFPVCCGSDEFFYFPQVLPAEDGWTGWDDFHPDTIEEVKTRLSSFENGIAHLSRQSEDRELLADAGILDRIVRTLREQFEEVRFHRTQPTFHLTVLSTGLASCLGDPDPGAWAARAGTVPAFLSQAREALTEMPRMFRDRGLEMVGDITAWLRTLGADGKELAPVASELERFGDFLRTAGTRERYLLPPETLESIVRDHIGCGAGTAEVRDAIVEELRETAGILDTECGDSFPGRGREEALRKAPSPRIPADGVTGIYGTEAENLLRHCSRIGIVPEGLAAASPLRVAPLPPYLRAIRAASAYSFTPGRPMQGGTFYVVSREGPWIDNREELAEYRMLAAHETWPGHHLLDSWRWHFVAPLRRPVELPLFYEGWACFAEELMRITGYFSGPLDRLLLARRRHRRAVRGLVELDLQAGRIGEDSAAARLVDAGFPRDVAASVVGKYALRPGYQICYTFGLRRFLDLHARYGAGREKRFVRTVLSGGETGFDRVEEALHAEFGPSREGPAR